MEEQLDFILGDSAVVELLGRQNFSNPESAVLELVKNAFDAGAHNCKIVLQNDSLSFIDDGKGMDESVIKNNWMVIGKSDKGYSEEGRVLSGSKGVGRFAIARLGNNINLKTKKNGKEPLEWQTDWKKNIIFSGEKKDTGTELNIKNLRDRWNSKLIDTVIDFLNRTYNDKVMKISVDIDNNSTLIEPLYNSPILGENFVSKITLTFNSKTQTLAVSVVSDEFLPVVEEITGLNTQIYNDLVSISESLEKDMVKDKIPANLISEIGDFTAELYFSPSYVQVDDAETFKYKYRKLPERYNQGVILYRNSFSISSLEGKKDWLSLNIRARKSPAAATHLNGQWRVRSNQLSGKIKIDKNNNPYLLDIANRQGLEENDHYKYFINIIQLGLTSFERYRQGIIRAYAKNTDYYEKPIISEDVTVKKFLTKPSSVKNFSEEETVLLASGIKIMQEQMVRQEKYTENLKENYKYDARILNLLATQGLRAMSVAHDLDTHRNSLNDRPGMIEEIIKDKGLWEELDNADKSYLSVPYNLEHLKSEIKPLIVFLDAMLSQNQKQTFTNKINSIEDYLINLVSRWKIEIENVKFKIKNIGTEVLLSTYGDVLDVIFDNLILNSYQQNLKKRDLEISIEFEIVDDNMRVTYSDNGKGLAKKYISDPMNILVVHESTRVDGHGLGMWLVNRTIISENGEISYIGNNNGFEFMFDIKGKGNGK